MTSDTPETHSNILYAQHKKGTTHPAEKNMTGDRMIRK